MSPLARSRFTLSCGCAVLSALVPATRPTAADPPPQYMCIVNGVDDYTREFAPPSPGSARIVCTGTIHYTLLRDAAAIGSEVTRALDAAEASGYPVFLNFDDWNFPPDSWSLDPAITEWTDWHGTLASHRTIEWSADNPNNPPPNVAGPAFRAAVAAVFESAFWAIAGRAAAWAAQGRGHLFAGIAVGWESGYYTEFDETPAFRTGFAALTARGLTDQAIAAGAQQRGVSAALMRGLDDQMRSLIERYVADVLGSRPFNETDFLREVVYAVTTLGRRGLAVIVGRGAAFILDPDSALRVLVAAPIAVRVERTANQRGLENAHTEAMLREEDARRIEFVRHHFGAGVGAEGVQRQAHRRQQPRVAG